jgi:cytochrome b6-f complex iron-sulfur subunit
MKPLLRTILGLGFGGLLARLLGVLGRFHATPRLATRRTFVRNAALGATGVFSALVGGSFLGWMWPNKTGAFGSELTVPAGEVPPVNGNPYRSTAGRFYLSHTDAGLLALYTKCPHLGCTVPYVGPADASDAFRCPCHGSLYNYAGERTGGPAPRPMDLMAVTVGDDGAVTVDTGNITTRAIYDPSQAVPYQA